MKGISKKKEQNLFNRKIITYIYLNSINYILEFKKDVMH